MLLLHQKLSLELRVIRAAAVSVRPSASVSETFLTRLSLRIRFRLATISGKLLAYKATDEQ